MTFAGSEIRLHNLRMRFTMAVFAAIAVFAASPAWADQSDKRLDGLFDQLRLASDEESALTIERQIWVIWRSTEDDDARILFASGLAALNRGDLNQAHESFWRATRVAPEFAEGWNMSSTMKFILGDYAGSELEARHVLQLEPRHFGALSGLSQIYMYFSRPRDSLAALERIHALYPQRPGLSELIRKMRESLFGKPL